MAKKKEQQEQATAKKKEQQEQEAAKEKTRKERDTEYSQKYCQQEKEKKQQLKELEQKAAATMLSTPTLSLSSSPGTEAGLELLRSMTKQMGTVIEDPQAAAHFHSFGRAIFCLLLNC